MQKSIRCIAGFVVIILLAAGGPAAAQFENRDDVWRTTGPGDSKVPVGSFWADPKKPSFVFAESNGALYRSSDAGLAWAPVATPLQAKVRPLLAAQGRLFIAVDRNGIFRSEVAGEIAWQQALAGITVRCLLEFNESLYAGTDSAGVFYSRDGGGHWTQAAAPMQDKSVDQIVALGNTLYALTKFGLGLFKSTDAGMNWTAVTLPTDGELLAAVNGMLFIGNHGRDMDTRGIWRSTDGGETWAQVYGPGLNTNVFRGLVAAGNKLFTWASLPEVDDRATFLVSDDGGQTWREGVLTFVTSITAVNGIVIAATARSGIFLSYDQGATWISASPPLDAVSEKGISALRAVGRTLYASVLDKIPRDVGPAFWAPGGVYISTDNGRNWAPAYAGLAERNKIFDAEIDLKYVLALATTTVGAAKLQLFRSADLGESWADISQSISPFIDLRDAGQTVKLYATAGSVILSSLFGKALIYSTDSGVTWQRPQSGGGYLFSLIQVAGDLYGGTTNAVIRSSDGGENWTTLPLNETVLSLLFQQGALYAGTLEKGLFFSTDGGASWTPVHQPLNASSVYHLIATANTIVAGTASGVFLSADGGRNWVRANAPMAEQSVTAFILTENRLYAGTSSSGILFSDDGGVNWTPARAPLDDKNVRVLTALAGRIYAGTNQGVYWTFAADGQNWSALQTGLGNLNVNDLGHLPVSNRFFAATDNGVYLQTLDTAPPVANFFYLAGGAAFTPRDTVDLLFSADAADSMIYSENADFSGASWVKYTAVGAFLLSPGDGLKTVYAKFKDLSANESAVRTATIVLDRSNPDFSPFPHTAPPNATPGRGVSITQQVAEDNLAGFDLFFRRVGETWDRNARKITFVNSTAVIDSERVNSRGLDYQIIATDKAGRSATLSNGAVDFFSLPVNIAAGALGNSRSLPSGTGGAAYRMISIPLALQNSPQVKDVFKGLGKYGRRGDWRCYSYSGSNQWQEGENVAMQTGAGYFMIRRDGGSLTNAISGATAKTTDGVLGNISGWQLRGGDWTLIGNPYNTRLELNQLKLKRKGTLLSNHGTEVQVWSYDGQWRNPATDPELALEPWGGLFIRASAADTIVFANDKEPYARNVAKTGIATTELAEGEWSIQITAASGECSDAVNYFGAREDAKEELDNFDWHEPPFLPDGVGLSFPHPEWDDPAELTADFRGIAGEGQRWEIVVKGEPARAVQLRFANVAAVPKELRVLLVDDATKITHDLRTETALAVRLFDAYPSRRMTILVGDEFYIKQNTAGLTAVPTTFALEQNYPNPFNPSTTIRYQLPVAGRVTLKIFDMMGREVLVLEEDKSREPGYYEIVADMRALTSGVYFYRLSVTGGHEFRATRKLLYVK